MRVDQLTEEPIGQARRQSESVTAAADMCRKLTII